MEKLYVEAFSSKNIRLGHIKTELERKSFSDEAYQDILDDVHKRLEEQQTLLYADNSRAMLIIFQGMDTADTDGAIKNLMSGVNPQGCTVVSFKPPSEDELAHDYLWRMNRLLPARGQIGIFNRSYYEEILVSRVHPESLKNQRLPSRTIDVSRLTYLDGRNLT